MKKTLILNEKVLTISEWLTENQPGEIQTTQTTQTTDIKSDIDTILTKLKEIFTEDKFIINHYTNGNYPIPYSPVFDEIPNYCNLKFYYEIIRIAL